MIECITRPAAATVPSPRSVSRARQMVGLRVGFVCNGDATNPRLLSGMPFQAMRALADHGVEIVPLFSRQEPTPNTRRWIPTALRRNLPAKAIRSSIRRRWAHRRSRFASAREYDRMIQNAERLSARLNARLGQLEQPVDLIFGMCISTQLFAVRSEAPIVYFSDATARLINESYPKYMRRSTHYKRACNLIERTALSRIAAGIFSSQRTLDSAIDDYHLSPTRAHLLPMGANVLPDDDERIEPDMPTRDRLELVIVATDPVRKRLDFGVEMTRELARRGWNVSLHAIGDCTWRAARCALVKPYGLLDLSNAAHRELHQSILRRSHFMLLPSVGEMFGIAPCEAAHFGRPSIVSDVGGLPTAVVHNQTGVCLPLDATVREYADHIERLSNDPRAYRMMSAAALERARTVLNWPTFARGVVQVFESVLRGVEAGPIVTLGAKTSPRFSLNA